MVTDGVIVPNELVALTVFPDVDLPVAVTLQVLDECSAHRLCHAVPPSLTSPATGVPPEVAVILVTLACAGVTVTAALVMTSRLPSAGEIDSVAAVCDGLGTAGWRAPWHAAMARLRARWGWGARLGAGRRHRVSYPFVTGAP
jgi:hypothetical protein